MQKLKLWLTSCALLLTALPNWAQEVHRLSLKQALEYAQKNNVQIKNALLDVLHQHQVNREITAAAFPQVSATGNLVDNLQLQTQLLPGEFFGQPPGTFVPITFGTKYLASGVLNAQQLLFDGQVFVGLQAKRTSINLQQNIADVTAEAIRANINKIYYQLVISKTQVALLDSTINMVAKMKNDVQIMYDNGFAEKLDIDKNEVQLVNLTTQKEKVLVQIANGYNGLKVLMGIPVKDQLILTDDINEAALTQDVMKTTDFNYEDRRDFQTLLLTKELNEYNIKRYRFSKLPTIGAAYNYTQQYMSNDLKFKKDNWFESSYIGLNLSLPIFKGFATNAKIKQAQLDVNKIENQLEDKKNTIDNEIINAKAVYLNSIETIAYQKKNMALADTIYQQTKKKYEIGTASQTDVDNAQNQLQTAQSNYYNALYDAIVARTDFLKAVGKI